MTVLIRITLLCALWMGTAAADASPQQKLDQLRQRISALQQELEKTSMSKSGAADALRESERAISNSNRTLAELAQQQRTAKLSLAALQHQTQQLKHTLRNQQTLLGKLLFQQYLSGEHDYLKLLLNNRDPNQIARDRVYYQYIARSRTRQIDMLRDNLTQLDTLVVQTRQKNEEIAALQAQQKTQKNILQKDQQKRQQTLVRYARQIKQQRHEMGRLQRDEAGLSQLVDKLTRALTKKQGQASFDNDNLPDDRFDGQPFEQLKGQLALPVTGKVTNKFGSQRPDSPVLWRGLQINAANGQAVKAIAAGRVVFADWLRGFGNLLIIDHGQNYMSLYANNETLYKQVGDTLRGGDMVASVGNTGGNEHSGLYFELRHKGKPLDPLKWINH